MTISIRLALGITPLDLEDLEADFDVTEVLNAIKEMPAVRAPGPDDFTGAFYKATWPVTRDDVMAAVQAFQDGERRGLHKLNSALIVLLPKRVGAAIPVDYQPITMIHSFTKLISKVLALRLAPKLNDLVDRNQNAFIRGRTIQDNFKYV